jgi:predicted phage tail protein
MGVKFGREHRFHLDTNTPAEAVAALISQVRGVREYLASARERGIDFAVFVGKRNVSTEHLRLPAHGDIRIAPIVSGSKQGGVLQVILGAVLLVVAYFVPVTAPYLAPAGWSLIAGGVIQMLTPLPGGMGSRDNPANTPNYNFNGPINTQAQGNPVPLAYGEVYCGSAVISAGIDVDDTAYVPLTGGSWLGDMGGGSWAGGGNSPYVRPGAP